MGTSPQHDVTRLLLAWGDGDPKALERLTSLVDTELRRLAHGYMRRERSGHLLQTTALVNEAYLRLIASEPVSWQNRAHFFGVAARLMRRILIDFARAELARKRGAGAVRVALDEARDAVEERGVDLVALDGALTALEARDARRGEIVVLRYFGGLSVKETAAVLGIAPNTVLREWKRAKVWLYRELSGNEACDA